jgi:hypothetical protein
MATKPNTPDDPAVAEAAATAPPPGAASAHASLIDLMKAHFAKEERVEVKVRNDGDVFVQINGYSWLIQPNVKVKVPKSVALLLEQGDYI